MKSIEKEKLNMKNVKLIGRFMNPPFGVGKEYEELYRTEEGQFVLYGNDGLKSQRRDYLKRIDMYGTDEEAMQEMDYPSAKKWAARYLTLQEYVGAFGQSTQLEKIFAGITNDELGEIFHTVNYIRATEENPELCVKGWASDYAMGMSWAFPGLDAIGLCEIVMRMLDLTDPVPEYVTPDDEETAVE